MICQSMQELIPQVMFIFFGNQSKKKVSFPMQRSFEVKFDKKSERVITDSRGRTADALFMNLESVALAIEGSDFSIPEDNFVPTAR